MASRENQGLQVALILLVMLTIGLCVTTFVFYSKASSRYAEAEDAREAKQTAEQERNQSNYQNQMLTYMMDGGAETWTAMAEQLDTYPVGDDPKINAIREEFKQDMLLFGGPDEPFEKVRNYQTLPEFLMARVRDLNKQLADLRQSENRLTAEKAQLEQAAAERTQNFEQAQKKAADDLLAEREKFNQDRAKLEQEKMAIASQLTEKDNKIAELQAAMDTLKQDTEKQLVDMGRILDDQKQQIKQFSRTSFEVPDAEITRVNQGEGVLYINVGAADNLKQGLTFSVYDKRQTGLAEATPKGRVRVTRILNDNLAECKIEEDDISDIIVPGDVVFSPVWTAGEMTHIAFAGLIDVTGNDRSDEEMLANVIRSHGGVIDETVTPQTRYLVVGSTQSGIAGQAEMTNEQRADFNQKVRAAEQIGVDQLSVDKLLSLMGWRPAVEAVSFRDEGLPIEDNQGAGQDAGGQFRPRTPPRGTNGAF